MRINHNIASLNTYRQLTANGTNSSKSLEKLSSGLRINRAGDDAAGLAISEKMRGQIRGLDQASRNAQDSISLIQTAEGGLNEVHSILQRMRELGVQASNETNTADDRNEIQKEINQLVDEIDKIGNTTEFNTKTLLNGAVGQKFDTNNKVDITNNDYAGLNAVAISTNTKTGAYAVDITVATKANISDSGAATVASGSPIAAGTTIKINGATIDIGGAKSIAEVAAKVNAQSSNTRVEAYIGDQGGLSFRATEFGVNGNFEIKSSADIGAALGNTAALDGAAHTYSGTDASGSINGDTATALGGNRLILNATGNAADGLTVEATGVATAATTTADAGYTSGAAGELLVINGVTAYTSTGTETLTQAEIRDAVNAVSSKTGIIAQLDDSGNVKLTSSIKGKEAAIDLTGTTGDFQDTFAAAYGSAGNAVTGSDGFSDTASDGIVTVETNTALSFHVGANAGQAMNVDISDMRSAAIGKNVSNDSGLNSVADLKSMNAMMTTEGAENAIKVLDEAIKNVSAERSKLGAFQNRLEHTINNLGTSSENLTAAESRIRDVDMAKEMMEFTKNNILSQAAQAMLAQANQQPQGVLQLLR